MTEVVNGYFERMEEKVNGKTNALRFLGALANYSSDYTAIVSPTHTKWEQPGYDHGVPTCVDNISQHIRMSFIRPLMLAVASRFEPREVTMAFRAIEAWVVRFLIAGGSRTGLVEKKLGETAHAIRNRQITTAVQLVDAVKDVVPNDTQFHGAFCTKTLDKGKQVKFILKELEEFVRKDDPANQSLTPTLDPDRVTLEHILPKNPSAPGWGHFTPDERRAYTSRLGNLVLLNSKDNGAAGDKPFQAKLPYIDRSKNILLTGMVLDLTAADQQWTKATIETRQARLATLALQRWPLTLA